MVTASKSGSKVKHKDKPKIGSKPLSVHGRKVRQTKINFIRMEGAIHMY
jgi:hypothetical protein